jgi:hypothetical protein
MLTLPRTKPLLWAFLGFCTLWVLALYEYPIFRAPNHHRDHLIAVWFLIIPHIIGGVIALTLGPLLFSTRFRQRRLKLHRLFGKTYVISVCVASLALIALNWHDVGAMNLFLDGSRSSSGSPPPSSPSSAPATATPAPIASG